MRTDNHPPSTQIAVIVNDQLWKEVTSFDGYGSDDYIYVVTFDRIGTATIVFGDGKEGRKPPIGSRIETTYRSGDGSNSNVLSFVWSVPDHRLHEASFATITTSQNSFSLGLYHGIANSWHWKFMFWLCETFKRLLFVPAQNKL